VLNPKAELKPEQQAYLQHFGQECPAVGGAKSLIVECTQLVREQEMAALEGWLGAADTRGVPELVEFAKGLLRDRCAVEGALRYTWSNGMTEGHVNRLKLIKRTAYGRASFQVLRQRGLARL
jgi:transposase